MTRRILWLGVVVSLLGWAEAPGVIAIRNARVLTVSGPAIDKGTVVVRDGLIEAVGANAAIPAGAWVVEGDGLTVYPGLIEGLGNWGIAEATPQRGAGNAAPPSRGPEDRPSTLSWVRAADVVNASDKALIGARDLGYTSAVIYPGNGLVSGHVSVLNLAGEKSNQMTLKPAAGLYMTAGTRGGGYPNSLLGVFAYFRQLQLDTDHYNLVRAEYEKSPLGKKRPEYDRALEGITSAERYLLPAHSRTEIDRMLRFSTELRKPVVLYGGAEAYRCADLLGAAKAPVLISLKWPERDRDADPETKETLRVLENFENAPKGAAVLEKAGVKYAFYGGGLRRTADYKSAVRKAITAGLTEAQALRAMTLSVAEIYGVSDRLGSIEPGKIANLVVATGAPFAEASKIRFVLVDGVKYEPMPQAEEAPEEKK